MPNPVLSGGIPRSTHKQPLRVPPAPRDPPSLSGCPFEIKCSKIPQKKKKKSSFFQTGPPLRGHKNESKFASVWLASLPQRPAETRFLLPMNESTMPPHFTVSRHSSPLLVRKPATPIQTPPLLPSGVESLNLPFERPPTPRNDPPTTWDVPASQSF